MGGRCQQTLTVLSEQSVSVPMSETGTLVRCAGTLSPGPAPCNMTRRGMASPEGQEGDK